MVLVHSGLANHFLPGDLAMVAISLYLHFFLNGVLRTKITVISTTQPSRRTQVAVTSCTYDTLYGFVSLPNQPVLEGESFLVYS